jgi:hypothetical protein
MYFSSVHSYPDKRPLILLGKARRNNNFWQYAGSFLKGTHVFLHLKGF